MATAAHLGEQGNSSPAIAPDHLGRNGPMNLIDFIAQRIAGGRTAAQVQAELAAIDRRVICPATQGATAPLPGGSPF